jgi:cobalt/nickel transport system permease protein
MHIPDGFIDGKTAATTAALSAVGVGLALRQVRRRLERRRVPLLGLAAAFLFAAQMINFPVYGGTSGHLLGGVLVAALLGPSAAIVVLTTVLIVQCFLFADGGVLALGANIFNMGIVGGAGGYWIYRLVCRALPGPRGTGGGHCVRCVVFDCAGSDLLRRAARMVQNRGLAGGLHCHGGRPHAHWHR